MKWIKTWGESLLESMKSKAELGLLKGITLNYPHMVEAAIRDGADVNSPISRLGGTSLHLVIEYAFSEEIFDMLLSSGADPDVVDRLGETPLYYAVLRGELEAVRVLLKAGADPNIKNLNGKMAISNINSQSFWPRENQECARLLILNGSRLTPAWSTFEEMRYWFRDGMGWYPGGADALERRFRAEATRNKMF